MLLYKKDDIEFIRAQLKNNVLKFQLREYKCLFSKSVGDILMQRVPNFMMGLGYDTEKDEFLYNYPHISNAERDNLMGAVGEDALIQPKLNGTNIGIIATKDGLIWRTRRSIKPDRFMNQVNIAILTGEDGGVFPGIKTEVFDRFKEKYIPILNEGKTRGAIDDFGNIVLKKIAKDLVDKIGPCIKGPNVVGVWSSAYTHKPLLWLQGFPMQAQVKIVFIVGLYRCWS